MIATISIYFIYIYLETNIDIFNCLLDTAILSSIYQDMQLTIARGAGGTDSED